VRLECGCEYDDAGLRIRHCGQAPAPSKRYSGEAATLRGTGERLGVWVCECPGLRPRERHAEPWQCLPAVMVAAYRWRHLEATANDKTLRMLAWLEETFS
jgi:hypothetical protein